MNFSDFLYIIFFFTPILFGPLAWWFLRGSFESNIIKIRIGKSQFIWYRRDLRNFLIVLLPYLVILSNIPIVGTSLLVGYLLFVYLFRKQTNSLPMNQDSLNILDELKEMQTKVQASIKYLESISIEIESKNIEFENRNEQIDSLKLEIDKRAEEYQNWKNLNDSEKQLLISAVNETVNSNKVWRTITFIAGTILLNIISTLIWVLLGAPGAEEIKNGIGNIF